MPIGLPSNTISPAFASCRPMIVRAVVVLPHPDSPASARTSPRRSSNEIPSTAFASKPFFPVSPAIRPTWPANVTCRSRTSITLSVDEDGPSPVTGASVALMRCPSLRARAPARAASTPPCDPGREARSSGSRFEHSSKTNGHRGWNEQPDGIFCGSGGSPPSPVGFLRNRSSPISGNAAASAFVYGCFAS